MPSLPSSRRRRRKAAGVVLVALSFNQACASAGGAGPAATAGRSDGEALARTLATLVWPLRFDRRDRVRSVYGYRPWRGGAGRYHHGLDLESRRGDPVHSAGDGTVLAVGRAGAYGLSIHVDHGQEVSTLYAHLDRALVGPGERVRRGRVIGRVGASGNATGPHLHFELRWRGRWVDPVTALPRLE